MMSLLSSIGCSKTGDMSILLVELASFEALEHSDSYLDSFDASSTLIESRNEDFLSGAF